MYSKTFSTLFTTFTICYVLGYMNIQNKNKVLNRFNSNNKKLVLESVLMIF